MSDRFINVADALLTDARDNGFAGWDPFDGLNSAVFQRSGLNRFPLARLAWVQLFKRLPINLRGMMRVPKRRNPKGVALFVLGMLEDHSRTRDARLLDETRALGNWLLAQRCNPAEWPHHAWGYHFDWQAKAFYAPAGRPNVITTWYVAKALLALSAVTGEIRYGDAALDAADFVADSLTTERDGYRYFAYIPGEAAFVHNASLWGAALVVVAGQARGDRRLTDLGLSVAHQSASMQAADGSWLYGTMPHHHFIDGFHTGYNLEALDLVDKTLATREFAGVIDRGMRYYHDNFFEADGTAKYYNHSRYPLDMHSVAQAVITFLRVGGSPYDAGLSEKVMSRALETMYIPSEKRFRYQVDRYWKNSLNYTRWTQAWSYYALSILNRTLPDGR